MTQKYPQRIEKSEAMYKMWRDGEGDIDELAIGLYNLIAEYKALYDDYIILRSVARAAEVAWPYMFGDLPKKRNHKRVTFEKLYDALKEVEHLLDE